MNNRNFWLKKILIILNFSSLDFKEISCIKSIFLCYKYFFFKANRLKPDILGIPVKQHLQLSYYRLNIDQWFVSSFTFVLLNLFYCLLLLLVLICIFVLLLFFFVWAFICLFTIYVLHSSAALVMVNWRYSPN